MGGEDEASRQVPDLLDQWLSDGGARTLDRFMGGAHDVLGVMDRHYVIRYVNRTAPGLTREGVVGQSAFSMIPPSEANAARSAFDHVFLTGTPAHFQISYPGEGGVIVFVVRVNPILSDGQVIGTFTLNTDVTEQRRETIDRDRFFSLSLDLLVAVTPEGHLRRINPAFAEALGYSVAELLDQPFIAFVHPQDVQRTEKAYARILSGEAIDDFENRYRRRDGAYRVFSWRATVDPIVGYVYAVARDITDHRATEAQLRHAQKMEAIGQLAGGVAHDFNNLMQAVLANVEFALSPDSTRTEIEEHLHEIQTAGQRAAELTKQLLVFSRRQRLSPTHLDLNELLRGVMKMLRRLLPESISIDLNCSHALPSVDADRTQLEQVVTNLCVNARDAMEAGGRLTLETSEVVISQSDCELYPWAKPGHFVCLSVTDTGHGMSPEVRERVFEPFFTTKEDKSGTGLGLSTLYGIVEQHGGMVHVYSELGLGATFKVYLPASEQRAPERTEPGELPVALSGQGTILVVEDEQIVQKPIVRILERAGYRTLWASNGTEAIQLLQAHLWQVDLVLLDLVMPELGGPGAWQRMRALRDDLKVLFMSGYADTRYRDRLPPGAEVLEKPFPSEELLRRVRATLDG